MSTTPTPPCRRSQHVEALLRRFPAKAINPDRSVFDLPLELRDGKATALRISLPLTSAVVDARQPGGAAGASIHRSKARAYVADALPSKTCLQIAVTSVRKAAYSAILPLCPWSQASRTRLATLRQQGACLPLGAPARV